METAGKKNQHKNRVSPTKLNLLLNLTKSYHKFPDDAD